MDAILSRLPSPTDLSDWATRHRGKFAGLFAGTVGLFVVTTFLTVAITGVPYGGERLDSDRTVVYPNF
ncbi:hypothetical protein [Pseudooctadecabacter jejudonensis]|uniref:Uncharacterized protein n=1 Tax=Pseudooctadecabacter jejudonensis TaxID=1391910 RepID=A0A1Y5RL96_9RHOB|nr:hypothetical protein [Pseudooctadecabacter jejudonensis]SLN17334.1 hypothetical protein PSJ8397_00546 [Pseudooctadecabacter jejudonensis]